MDMGLGYMINALSDNGDDSINAIKESTGKVIDSLRIDSDRNGGDGELMITFTDGSVLGIYDSARSCCESRYMMTDDKLEDFVGSTLSTVEVKDGPEENSEWGVHETQFLVVGTSKGHFTCVTHNEHNGYYGGFWMKATLFKK